MTNEFEIVVEGEYPGSPEQVWQAVTAETSAWLFPVDGMPGKDLVVERPTHHVNRMEGPDGWFNQLEQVIEERPDGRAYMRWVHSGVFAEDWDAQYDGASKHTDFYLHTLGEYLEHFAGQPVVFAEIQGPPESQGPGAFDAVRTALGVTVDTEAGGTLDVTLPGEDNAGGVLDYSDNFFIGVRTEKALYRFFGRNAFGAPVAITVHHFDAADAATLKSQWQEWLDALFVEDAEG